MRHDAGRLARTSPVGNSGARCAFRRLTRRVTSRLFALVISSRHRVVTSASQRDRSHANHETRSEDIRSIRRVRSGVDARARFSVRVQDRFSLTLKALWNNTAGADERRIVECVFRFRGQMLKRAVLAAMLVCVAAAGRAQSFTIRWNTDEAQHAVEVEGVPRDALASLAATERPGGWWAHVFAVFAEQTIDPSKPPPPRLPLAGRWTAGGDRLRFEPRLPLAHGVTYRAEFWPSRLPGPLGGPSILLGALGGSAHPRPVVSFFELPPDRTPPDPARWTFVSVPASGTREPLILRFDEPLNPVLALRSIAILLGAEDTAQDETIPGDATMEPGGRGWRFMPEHAWKRGAYRVVVAPTIEDLAGNSSARNFDMERVEGAPMRLAPPGISLPFAVK